MRASEFLSRLKGVKPITTGGWVALCQGHDDDHPSLRVSEGSDKRVLIHCAAGCTPEQVVRAMGLTMRDLMPETDSQPKPKVERRKIKETPYALTLPNGDPVEHVRIDYDDGSKSYYWRTKNGTGLGGISAADVSLFRAGDTASGLALICEGEKSALAAYDALGFDAFGTACGASSCPTRRAMEPLRDRDVAIWADHDPVGEQHARNIAVALDGIAASCRIVTWGTERGDDVADFVRRGGTREQADEIIDGADEIFKRRRPKRLHEGVKRALANLDRYTSHDWSDRVPTGIQTLDRKLAGGMRPGRVILLGAPTGSGKTTMVQQLACACARERGPVLIVSPEMDLEELAEREILRESGTPAESRGFWQRDEQRKENAIQMHGAAAVSIERENLPVYILDDAVTMGDVEEVCKSIKDLKLVVIDYAQEVADDSDPRKARYLAVGDVARKGVQLARRFKCPVLIASQVNTIKGKNGEILDYEFRETRVLEQKAAVVLVLVVKWDTVEGDRPRVTETKLVCRKHRGGALFSLRLSYEPEIFKLGDERAEVSAWQGKFEEVVL